MTPEQPAQYDLHDAPYDNSCNDLKNESVDDLGIVFFPAFDWTISPTHPEREERLLYTLDQFNEEGIFDLPGISFHNAMFAEEIDISRTHFCLPSIKSICTDAHLVAAGGAIKAARLVLEGKCKKAFAMIRPPGHHAMRIVHGCRGFCNINNEAIMIEHIRKHFGHKRIAIVDTDCHHGDGTQDIYWHDPDTLFISLHQDGRTIYPGTGFPHELGGPGAMGRTINIPMAPGTGDAGLLYLIQHAVLPLLEEFKPDLIINSAGQDNHFSDPITNMQITAQGYAKLTEMLNPDIVVLEGGYSIHGALPYVNLGIALALAGKDYSYVHEPENHTKSSRIDWKKSAEHVSGENSVGSYIKHLVDVSRGLYTKHPDMPCDGKIIKEDGKEFFIREKEISYDTDNILEQQREMIVICPDCHGSMFIESKSRTVGLSACINIPASACQKCYELGVIWADGAKKSRRYNHVILQNRAG